MMDFLRVGDPYAGQRKIRAGTVKARHEIFLKHHGSGRDRTAGLLIANEALSQTELPTRNIFKKMLFQQMSSIQSFFFIIKTYSKTIKKTDPP